MPSRSPRPLPPDWQIAPRWDEPAGATRYYVQQRQDDGAWRDVSGPYRRRDQAWESWRRRVRDAARDHRPAGPSLDRLPA